MSKPDVKEALDEYARQHMQSDGTNLWPRIEASLQQSRQVGPAEAQQVADLPASRSSIIPPQKSPRPGRSGQWVLSGLVGVTVVLVGLVVWAVFSTAASTLPPTNTAGVAVSVPTATPSKAASPSSVTVTHTVLVLKTPANLTPDELATTKKVLEDRLTALGATHPKADLSTPGLVKVETDGIKNQSGLVATLTAPGRVEFVDAGTAVLNPGDVLQTSYCTIGSLYARKPDLCGKTAPAPASTGSKTYQTVITGQELDPAGLELLTDASGAVRLGFVVKKPVVPLLQAFTLSNIQHTLAITLDGKVISAPVIQGQISDKGEITSATWATPQGRAEATDLLAILKSEVLPVTLQAT